MGNWFCRFIDAYFTRKERVLLTQLPQELITEILMWLPVKSLMRFRCVSKSFCAIINSKQFIYSHLNRSYDDKSHLNLIFETSDRILINNGSAEFHGTLQVTGYCNGVFLLEIDECKLALWNPSTHQLRILPSFPFDPNFLNFSDVAMGLGYCSFQDDYKIVVIEPFSSHLDLPAIVEYRFWVFGLRSNTWRRVCIDFQPYINGFYFGCFAHGDLHWVCGNETNDWKIVTFDLAKETLSILAKPTYNPIEETKVDLHVLDGCLSMSFFTDIIKGEARLYVRKKEEAKFAWSLLYLVTTDQLPSFTNMQKFSCVGVFGYSKEGDKIMLHLDLDYVVSYDIKEKRFQQTDITLPNKELLYPPLSFVESLVSVHATDEEGNQTRDGMIYYRGWSNICYCLRNFFA